MILHEPILRPYLMLLFFCISGQKKVILPIKIENENHNFVGSGICGAQNQNHILLSHHKKLLKKVKFPTVQEGQIIDPS